MAPHDAPTIGSGPDLAALLAHLDLRLAAADAELAARFPGHRGERQPVSTVYVPADRYDAGTVTAWGAAARAALQPFATDPEAFAAATGLPAAPLEQVLPRVLAKLTTEPIEDLRIDFEDGYGSHPDDVEDAAVQAAATALRSSLDAGTAPPFVGIRCKSFEAPTRTRGVRTLVGFVTALATSGPLPSGLRITLPKVTSVDQVEAMVQVCRHLETRLGLAGGTITFEIQVETPQSVIGPDGGVLVARMVHAGDGRVTGLHYGTYDYSASCGIAGQYQSLEHPAADFAKSIMQVVAAGTGVLVSDGSSNVLPVGDPAAVQRAWRLHARLVRRSLERGLYQGWDLHAGQLVTRYAANHVFFAEGLSEATSRVRAWLDRQDSGFLDEPATAIALAGFLARAVDCGATDLASVQDATGLDRAGLLRLARRAPEADPATGSAVTTANERSLP